MENFRKQEIEKIVARIHQALDRVPTFLEGDEAIIKDADGLLERIQRGFILEGKEKRLVVGDVLRAVRQKSTPAFDRKYLNDSHDLFAQFIHEYFSEEEAPQKVAEARVLLAAWPSGTLTEDGVCTLREFFLRFAS